MLETMSHNSPDFVLKESSTATSALTTAEELYSYREYGKAHDILGSILAEPEMPDHIQFVALIFLNKTISGGFDTDFGGKYKTDRCKLEAMTKNNNFAVGLIQPSGPSRSAGMEATRHGFLDDLLEIEKCLQDATKSLKDDGSLTQGDKEELLKAWEKDRYTLLALRPKSENSGAVRKTSGFSFSKIKKLFHL